MTVITNSDTDVTKTVKDVQDFFSATLGIDISAKHLVVKRDSEGRIYDIDVDVSLTAPQIALVEAEFFKLSIASIIAALFISASATSILDDQVASPIVIPINNPNVLTDINIPGAWNLGADASQFTLVDADTGEIQYTGTVPRTVLVAFNLTFSIVAQFDNIYAVLMRTPDGGSASEVPGSRIYTETVNSNSGQGTSSIVAITLQPLDKLKINIANNDDDTNIEVTIATLTVK